MVRYKDYTMEQYQTFLSQEFNSTFGLSDDQIVNWFMSQAGSQGVIQSYGVNADYIRNRIFPALDERNLGHFMFLAITAMEGGGAGNWINHYMHDTSSDGFQCALDDMAYIKTLLTTGATLNVSAPECIQPWVEDNPGQAQTFYAKIAQTSIGAYYMAATFAGNAWVWATNWCEANQGPRPPAIYFGNPYDDIMHTVEGAGGDISKGGGTKPKPNPTPKPKPKPDGSKPSDTGKPTFTAPVMSKNPIKNTGRQTLAQMGTGITYHKTAGMILPNYEMIKSEGSSNQESNDNSNHNSKPKPKPNPKPINPPAGGNSDVWDFVQTIMGTNQGSGQCYALAQAITLHFGGNPLVGFPNASDIWHDYAWGTGNLSQFESHQVTDQNGSELARGDILCIKANGQNDGWYLHPVYGHVVVVSKVAGGQVEWVDQNGTGNLDQIQLRPISFTQNFPYLMTGYIRKVR
ncbi:CHAP domain-containing protein [Lactococcus petauri]|uniref:CHAP domain-containing protein n=1 Tax=Lactococcus petauri TaxID=1940789 RepID=UPI0021F1BEF5|nr:CHAP domain-containing protein [Lactococcus petauri]MCV5953908.1 CHAP domain-containing protein [Lactococcus petauri]